MVSCTPFFIIRSLSKLFECLTRKISSRNQFKTYKCRICIFPKSKSSRSNRNLHRRFVVYGMFSNLSFQLSCSFLLWYFFLFITHVEQPKNNMTSRQSLYVHVYYFYTTTHHLSVWHRGKTCFRYKCLSGKTYSPTTHNIMCNHYLLFFMITRCPLQKMFDNTNIIVNK